MKTWADTRHHLDAFAHAMEDAPDPSPSWMLWTAGGVVVLGMGGVVGLLYVLWGILP